jgi:hypothetical protein
VRWHGRLELEAPTLTLTESQLALATLAMLGDGQHEAVDLLRTLLRKARGRPWFRGWARGQGRDGRCSLRRGHPASGPRKKVVFQGYYPTIGGHEKPEPETIARPPFRGVSTPGSVSVRDRASGPLGVVARGVPHDRLPPWRAVQIDLGGIEERDVRGLQRFFERLGEDADVGTHRRAEER